MKAVIGKIERVDVRKVWPKEASDFTPWLADNIEVLNEILDMELVKPETEQAAGTSFVDMVVEDGNGDTVIIENQLERSNHDHLGKVLTYLAAYEAKAAIWIVADARPEHINAISWLNEARTDVSFYLLKVEAVKIGDSEPAALFTQIVGPSEEAKSVGKKKMEMAEKDKVRYNFWAKLLENDNLKNSKHNNISPTINHWLGIGAGITGVTFNYVILKKQSRIELYIDRGEKDLNKNFFDAVSEYKEKIEASFGTSLEWDRGEAKRSSKISYTVSNNAGIEDKDQWSSITNDLTDTMIRFEKAIRPYIKKIKGAVLNNQ